jgi:hypothetical protein
MGRIIAEEGESGFGNGKSLFDIRYSILGSEDSGMVTGSWIMGHGYWRRMDFREENEAYAKSR